VLAKVEMELTIPIGAIISAIVVGGLAEEIANRMNFPEMQRIAWAHYAVAGVVSILTIYMVCVMT